MIPSRKQEKPMPSENTELEGLPSHLSSDVPAPEPHIQQSKDVVSHLSSPTLLTEEGRLTLYAYWVERRFVNKKLTWSKNTSSQKKIELFTDWLRTLVIDGKLDPRNHFPIYQVFAEKPFFLKKKQVAEAIHRLRDEHVLPMRKTRKDKGHPQWTKRDEYCFRLIAQMRAMRLDQLQRVLAQWSTRRVKKGMLSLSRTVEIVDRWEKEKFASYVRINYRSSGWVYMNRKGLRHVGLNFRASVPSERILDHLYMITEVRMKLEATYPTMHWISERSLQAEQQERRRKGQQLKHFPDGILLLPGQDGKLEAIDIEVQISNTAVATVMNVMGDSYYSGSDNPLQYYVNKESRGVVNAAYKKMGKEQKAMRPSIKIIDLEIWLPLSPGRK